MYRRMYQLCLLLLCLLLLGSRIVADEPAEKTIELLGGPPEKAILTVEEQRFLALLNTERKALNLPELVITPLLLKVAREKSKEMYDLKYWGHESPVKEKRTAMRRVLYHLPKPPVTMTVGENLCLCPRVMVDEGHQALMASPTHKANILNPVYKYVGIGCYTAPDGRSWTTEIFLDITYDR